jgi:hypothetical protein
MMHDFLERVFRALNESKVPYIVTGAEAVAVYGRVRTTRDCDVIAKEAGKSLVDALKDNGFSVHELVRGHNSILDTRSNKYIDLTINPDIDFERYKFVQFKNIKARFTTPEDLILKKLEFSAGDLSSTDVEDIISIMLRQRKSLDTDYLIREASRKDTYTLLKKIIERIEERTWEE